MGSTVAPKMFSQPGVFGTSDTSSVINKTNPMAGLAGALVPPPPPPAPASTPTTTPASTPAANTASTASNQWLQWLNGGSNVQGRSPAFYGY